MSEPAVVAATKLARVVWATRGASIGAFVFLLLEFVNGFREEMEYLWTKRTRVRFVTYLYAWSRYFPLCAQIVNFTLSEVTYASPSPKICFVAYIAKAVTSQLVTTCVEGILAVRVHALYNCSFRTGVFLVTILILGTALEIAGTATTLAHLEPGIGGSICVPDRCPAATLAIYASGTGIIQITLLVMTLFRILVNRHTGWMRTPVVSLVLRDGILVFVMLAIMTSVLISFEIMRTAGVLVWNAAFSWYVTLLSIAGCRLVMNMRKLAVNQVRNSQRNSTMTAFSSIFGDFSVPS